MINNRQNGRRRGRGGQRPQGNPGQPGGGSRIDNRARGNAQQLHEKYKNLARDAQMAGDRVTTEYYLQFADHYFRVLSESRARFEDQRPQNQNADEDYDGEDGGDEFDVRDQNRGQRSDRGERFERGERNDRGDRGDRGDRNGFRRDEPRRERQPEPVEASEQEERQAEAPQPDNGERRVRRPRRAREESAPQVEGFDADRLPPAIAVASDAAEEAAPPRRRGRRPRAEVANDTVEVPPAA
ncbi:DUF4167 domain-containing protein [Sphingomonas sp. ID1715]|uniref:DUF4167 domain-containing protein n=1 Tax=Sphingomonas sp. ID1715 TaxID=1656898 RepID=UPI001489C46A|nr:DUF4167 domain-containing protein [Sphingomonas sp. ID1715]NNM77542.1 DUF4167 domain-containing protein [Sphingomonas sp. ID1715]